MTKYFLGLLLLVLPVILFAQHRHMLKTDLTMLVQKGARLGYEFRLNPTSSLELSFACQKHENQPDWMFQGDQIAHYLQKKLNTFENGRLVHTSGWQNVESEPLPVAPDFFPISSLLCRLGWRFSFVQEHRKWNLFLQPGLAVSRTNYFEIKGQRREEGYSEDSWILSLDPYRTVERESVSYEQTRSMRLKNKWIWGLTYDLGFVRKLGKHFFLEGRLSAGGNLTVPYKSPRPPVPVRGLWVQPVVMAGWFF